MNTDPNPTLERLDQALTELQAGRLDTRQFVALARDQPELLARLPPRYAEVLNGLLDRLESSALFSEESCSFSQKDLVANLRMWADKARGVLEQP